MYLPIIDLFLEGIGKHLQIRKSIYDIILNKDDIYYVNEFKYDLLFT